MSGQQLKILVVDDDPFVRDTLRCILESNDYSVITAENGIDALEQYFRHPDICLIISDMRMPEMDGLELIRSLRRIDEDLPVIILTAIDELSVALKAIQSGATDYHLKDENIQDTLLISVGHVIEKFILKKENAKLLEDLELKNRQLRKNNKELIELNNVKNKFLGIAAHDMRSPLAGIKGFCELLLESSKHENLNSYQKKYINMIHSAAVEMLGLVNDLLDVSVIESGKLDIRPIAASLEQILFDRIKLSQVVANKKEIVIHTDIRQMADMRFDPKRIAQVIDNFMSNAVKYSPINSNISVTMYVNDEHGGISVKDEGAGISKEEQGKLFGTFQRLSVTPTGGEKSTGLGLAIVKKIIDGHKGRLKVESEPGRGSTFIFEIPLKGP